MDMIYQLLYSFWIIVIIYNIIWYILRKQRIGNIADKYVLITGCDSGFGYLLVKRLDNLGVHVFAGCYTQQGAEQLKSVCSSNTVPVNLDVTKESSISDALDAIKKLLPKQTGLWAVVNNAGILGNGDIGPVTWQSRKDYEETLRVNLYGVINVTNACLPFVQQENGRIINTSSIMGRITLTATAPYVVSKYGVEAFSDIIRRHLYLTGTSVHLVSPGFFKTPLLSSNTFEQRIAAKLRGLPQSIRAKLPPDTKQTLLDQAVKLIDKMASPNVHLVVDAYEHAITARYPRTRYLVGFDAKYIFRPLWILPEWISDFIIVRLILKQR